MKAIALGARIARDIDDKGFIDISTEARQQVLDAINGGLQRLHALAPYISKTTTGSIYLAAPESIMLGVTNGSTDIDGFTFSTDHLYGTIVISGDEIHNQVIGETELLHPYGGTTGTVSATIYWDGVAMPEPYDELIDDPMILETGRMLIPRQCLKDSRFQKQAREPLCYWMEANASNQNSPAPSVIRFDSLPDRAYRLEARFTLAPVRITFADLLVEAADIPLRAEQIESYLIPIARGILSGSAAWLDKKSITDIRADSLSAERRYVTLTPQTLSTPRGRVGSKAGY